MSTRPGGGRYWAEVSATLAAFVLAVVTILWRDWIELVFRVDPDNHGGAVEWAIVASLLLVALLSGFSAQRTWRRTKKPARLMVPDYEPP
jgi:hypothetical protein